MNTAPQIIVLTDTFQLIKEIESAYANYVQQFNIPDDHLIVVNYSGGKDSTATLAIANHLFGDKVHAVMSDTDNEHSYTIDYARNIHEQIGCKPVQVVKKIYTQADFDKRREAVKKSWSKKQTIRIGKYRGIVMPSLARSDTVFGRTWLKTAERWGIEFETPLDACLSALKPSGNSFLDAALLHGKFPQLRDRFCTEELKIRAAFDGTIKPLIDDGEIVVQWSGVRGDESEKRARYPRFSTDLRDSDYLYNFLPIQKWTAADVFALHKYFGVKPNPLYLEGCGRVGCMNCILSNKEEICETAARWPEHIEKHYQWELQVRLTSRWVHWMSVGEFSQKWMRSELGYREVIIGTDEYDDPIVKRYPINLGGDIKLRNLAPEIQHIDWSSFYGPRGNMGSPSAYDVLNWARTGRGGQVYDLVKASIDTDSCASKYGLCG